MSEDPLECLDLSPDRVTALSSNDRRRLLHYLLRWEHIDSLHACLDALTPLYPGHVSLLDLRAGAFLARQQFDQALSVMRARLQINSSVTARSSLARVHLARGDYYSARAIADPLVAEQPDSVIAWRLQSEVRLAEGELQAAAEACRRLGTLRPRSRDYLLGMVRLCQARGDWVAASGYAVQLLQTARDETPLPVYYLRLLRDYFQESEELNRVADVDNDLQRRHDLEWRQLQAAFLALEPEAIPLRQVADAGRVRNTAETAEVPVSAAERARISAAARRLFGFASMLPGQAETIACALRGEDVLCILPTGGGKSLCYQLPALMADRGTVLVISPLIALMKDQVDSLPGRLRSKVVAINSSLDGRELSRCQDRIAAGAYRLVYAAPERLRQPPFLYSLRRAGITRLVIDEAHCVSAWGHDFRPDYLAIGQARQDLDMPPVLAMTATAPPRVRHDILQHLREPAVTLAGTTGATTHSPVRTVLGPVTRPNLRLEVLRVQSQDAKLRHLLAICTGEVGSGIVYACTRARCEELAKLLRRFGVAADHYHAGLVDRARAQEAFMTGHTRVIVATIAFGLGIDKPDIRFILHYDPPSSLEAYYQEAGRAGRDGQASRCTLLASPSDRATLTRRARRDALSPGLLRETYRAVEHRLAGAACGAVASEDLQRDLRSEDTHVRVALSLLEEAGLLRRGADLPRGIDVRLRTADLPRLPADLQAFCAAARLRPGQSLYLRPTEVALKAGLHPREIEPRLLEWAARGWLAYQASGRDLLLELPPAPPGTWNRIPGLVEKYEAIQAQRVDELWSYARTRHCRHRHISTYLGAPSSAEPCVSCDNCRPAHPLPPPELPSLQQQYTITLRCVADAPWSWGRRTLARILRGDDEEGPGKRALHSRARDSALFGALAFRSDTAVTALVTRLLEADLLRARCLRNKGTVIDLTPAGAAALRDPAVLARLARLPASSTSPEQAPRSPFDAEKALFEALRTWRREEARRRNVPAYIVFHDSVLRAIAAHQPSTPEELATVKGVGPASLERYGAALLSLVIAHTRGGRRDVPP